MYIWRDLFGITFELTEYCYDITIDFTAAWKVYFICTVWFHTKHTSYVLSQYLSKNESGVIIYVYINIYILLILIMACIMLSGYNC